MVLKYHRHLLHSYWLWEPSTELDNLVYMELGAKGQFEKILEEINIIDEQPNILL